MKRLVNHLSVILSLLIAAIAIAACTLIDNDLRDLPDEPAYREVVHEEGEGYTADYQYQPWTILVDDTYENYIASMDYLNSVLYLHDYIPSDLLPYEGSSLAAKPSDKLEWGLSYKVSKVIRDGSYYAVIMERAELLDIFKHIEYNQEDSFMIQENSLAAIDTTQNDYVLTRAGGSSERIPYDKPNDPYWTEKVKDFGTIKLDLIQGLKTIAAAKTTFPDKKMKIAAVASGITGAITEQFVDEDLGTIHNIRWSSSGESKTSQQIMNELLENKNKKFNSVQADAKEKDNDDKQEEVAREERKKRELFYGTNLKDAFSLEIDGWIQCLVSLTPTLKTKNYVYADEKDKNGGKTDVAFEICGDFGFSCLLGGKVTANIDLLYVLEHITQKARPQIAKVIAAPAGIPVWVQVKPLLNWLTSVEGRVGYNGHKYFSIGCGYRKNIKGKQEGLYKINNTKELEWNEKKKWTAVSGFNSKIAFETQIKFVPQAVLGIGIPGVDFLNAITQGTSEKFAPFLNSTLQGGVNITLEYDPSIAVDFKAERDESMHGQTHLHFGIPVSWKDLLFVFRPWPGWEFPINFGDYLCKWLGADGMHEFFPKDWYWYPVTTLGVTCTNPDSSDPPKFHFEYVVDDLGINYNEKEPSSPTLSIYKAGQESREAMYTQFYPSLKKTDTGKHFELDLDNSMLYSGAFKRGEIYNARLELHDDDGNLQCYTDNYFTSVTPSAYVKSDKLLAYEGRYSTRTNYRSNWWITEPTDANPYQCIFTFDTEVEIQNYEKVVQLGFYVGKNNKRYVCEKSVAGKTLHAIWEMTTNHSHYILSIRPFVAWVDKYGRTIENIWPTAYTLDYDFLNKTQCPRDPNWGGSGKVYKKYPEDIGLVTTPASYYSYGKDNRTEDQKNASVNAKEKSEESRTGTYIGEEDGVPTYVFSINPDDLE